MLNRNPFSSDPPEVLDYVAKLFSRPILVNDNAVKHAGRRAWRALHEYYHGNPDWLTQWFPMIPAGCGCKGKAEDIMAECPPRYESPEAWFAWTVDFHNCVNRRLGKPEFTIDEALFLWRAPKRYGLVSPGVYGGLERWSISLASRVPCYGFHNTTPGQEHDRALMDRLRRVAPEATAGQMRDAGMILVVSGAHHFRRPDDATVVAVAHGTCTYTRGFLESIAGQYDHLVAVSDSVADACECWVGHRPTVIENGVDTDRIAPTADRDALRVRFGLPTDGRVLGMTGRLTPDKGLDAFIAAMRALPDFHGLLIGWGNIPAIEAQLADAGLSNRVRLHRAIEQIGDALAAMDVMLAIATTEGFGLSVMEGMMAGLPVVTTDTGIAHDLRIRHGDHGPAIVPVCATSNELIAAVDAARPSSLDLSRYTSDAMADRWRAFLGSIG